MAGHNRPNTLRLRSKGGASRTARPFPPWRLRGGPVAPPFDHAAQETEMTNNSFPRIRQTCQKSSRGLTKARCVPSDESTAASPTAGMASGSITVPSRKGAEHVRLVGILSCPGTAARHSRRRWQSTVRTTRGRGFAPSSDEQIRGAARRMFSASCRATAGSAVRFFRI